DKYTLLRLIRVVSLVAAGAQVTKARMTCYYCSTNTESGIPYDSDCDSYYYNGSSISTYDGYTACDITVSDNGYVYRGGAFYDHTDGECSYGLDSTQCYCVGDYCNTESYCAQCGYPRPTPGTTELTTLTTSEPPPTTMGPTTENTSEPPTTTMEPITATTSKPSQSTSSATTLTSAKPPGSLRCYNCINCSSVDEDSTDVLEDEFLACTTIIFLDSTEVIRGGTYDEHPDGECVEHTASVSCWCSHDLCNNYPIDF
ncbi:unnamed protein product, partial [Meganyctiphanes norvegica]